MAIVPNTQEAIVTREQFDRVQELRKNKRRRTKAERRGLFSGLLVCADCGSKLYFHAPNTVSMCKIFAGLPEKQRDGAGSGAPLLIRPIPAA